MTNPFEQEATRIADAFYETYDTLGAWQHVHMPARNVGLLRDVVRKLLDKDVIRAGSAARSAQLAAREE